MDQESTELIWVKESCNIEVNTTDTQAAVSLQAGLELAIALVINIAIASSEQADGVSQELLQHVNTAQRNKQKIFIYNTKDARVTTTDTDLAINIQALLQVLIALVVMIDIL
ncbi:spore coat protein [Virgibacillus sp. YIM 98842]|uniref:spore coat protein n=1 Tax=Virgibacillus sp. YIM 98842 TaxID=2663533 RepID=UPI001F08F908|nr:spore coat protein [Virgibacillus sp. YIM 98842]